MCVGVCLCIERKRNITCQMQTLLFIRIFLCLFIYFIFLQILCDSIQSAEPIALELDRNLQVLLPSQAAKKVDLPPVFFNLTAEELKKEQQMRFVIFYFT